MCGPSRSLVARALLALALAGCDAPAPPDSEALARVLGTEARELRVIGTERDPGGFWHLRYRQGNGPVSEITVRKVDGRWEVPDPESIAQRLRFL